MTSWWTTRIRRTHSRTPCERCARRPRAPIAIVFGCGGDRNGENAPNGRRLAAQLADRLYLTSDNPRSEEPRAIVDDMLAGIPSGVRHHVESIAAWRSGGWPVAEAQAGDVVLVAGKGHEAYQIVGERILPFDDAAVAREALALLGASR